MRLRHLLFVLISLAAIAAVLAALLLRKKDSSNIPDSETPLVYVPRGTGQSVTSTAWSADERFVLTCDGNSVILWDAVSGREMRRLDLAAFEDASAVFLPDGKRFLLGGIDSSVQSWETATFSVIKRFPLGAPVEAIAMSKRGDKFLSTTKSAAASLWDINSGRKLRDFPTAAAGSRVAVISPDGKLILIQGEAPKTLTLWSIDGEKLRDFQLAIGVPTCGAFSSDGSHIACGTGDSEDLVSLRLWGLGGMMVHPDSAEIRVWNVADGGLVCHIRPDSVHAVLSVQFDPDGKQLITTAADSVVRWWDLETCRLASQFTNRNNLVQTAVFSPDRKRLLTAGDNQLRIWDLTRREVVRSFVVKPVFDGRAGMSADGSKLYVAPFWGHCVNREFAQHLLVWDIKSCRRVADLDPRPGKRSYGFSEDCAYFFARIPTDVPKQYLWEFWSTESGLLGRTKEAVEWLSGSWDFTADGRFAAANIDDSVYVCWETATGKEVRRIYCSDPPYPSSDKWFTAHDALSLSDDGKYAVVGRQPAALILNFSSGTAKRIHSSRDNITEGVKVRRAPWDSTTSIFDCQISADGQLAVFSWYDHSIDVWDVPNQHLLYSYIAEGLEQNKGLIARINISRDKKTFIGTDCPISRDVVFFDSGRADTVLSSTPGRFGIWDLPTGKLLRRFGGDTYGIVRLNYADNERLLIATCMDNGVRVFNTQSGKEILHLLSFENEEWLAVTPEGYYTASLNGDAFLSVRTGTKITGIEPYRSTFYQPRVVEAALRLGDSELAVSEVLGCKDKCATIADMADMEPPFIAVKYPDNGDTLRTADTTLAFRIEDRRYPIAAVRVFVNGRPVKGNPTRGVEEEPQTRAIQLDIPKDKKSLDLKVPLRLDEGDNLITIAALGKSEALDTLHVFVLTHNLTTRNEMDTVWILAVGVNKYQDKKLNSLKYCQNDARGIIESFKSQEGKTCRKVMSLCLTDTGPVKPTYENIVDNIGYLRHAKEHDLAVLFLAGHGVNDAFGDFYFLPTDAEVTGPKEFKKSKAISGAMLQTAVDVPSRRFVFVDACHSEGMAVDLVKLSRDFKENRVLVMSSSEGSKPSEEADSLRHGLFTYALIRGLQGDADRVEVDGKVSALELTTFVSERVSTLTHQRQNPVFWAPGGLSNFTVAMRRTALATAMIVE